MHPLTERQREIVLVLALAERPLPPSEIAYLIGMHKLPIVEARGKGAGGQGSGHRVFSPAQRIIGSLNGLKLRGMAEDGPRDDHLTGVAYSLTPFGESVAEALKAQT